MPDYATSYTPAAVPGKYQMDYVEPDFLSRQSADEIHARMLANLPRDLDLSEGNITWDFTRPSALEKAEMVQFELNEAIKLIFPQWSYGTWLELHGERANCYRRPANHASGTVNITGQIGTIIPSGFQLATVADQTESIIFEVMGGYVLEGHSDNGMVTNAVEVRAVEGGPIGNVAADTIKLMVKPARGIVKISNPEALTGGTDPESDSDYLVRILDNLRGNVSMTGCNADYIRWAKEVAAVGQVVVDPEWNDPTMPEEFHYVDAYGNRRCAGAVRLVIVDSNGAPGNKQLLDAVYLHIAGTGDQDPERLMPIGAHLTVVAPEAITVSISAHVILEDGEDLETVKKRFIDRLPDYWRTVAQEAVEDVKSHTGYIRMVQVGAVLAKTPGVLDYTELKVNNQTANIKVSTVQYPVTGEVTLSE